MRIKSKQIALLLSLTILILGAGFLLWFMRVKIPQKPTSITRGDYSSARDFARQRVEQVMKQRHIPGVALVMIDDQEIIWQASYGWADIEQKIPVHKDTVFKLWSLSKPFTAIEIMRLVEAGQLDLDAPLADYVPGFSIQSRFPNDEPVTLRRILTHRSGLPRNACQYGFGWETGPDALRQLAAALKDCYLAYPTGERYKYSNVAFDTLGYIIQAERQQPFPAYIRAELLLPIGMASSAFYSTELPAGSQLALGYEYYKRKYHPYSQVDIASIPSGNLYASSTDLATFVKFLFRDGQVQGRQLISRETLDAMFEDQSSHPADPQPMGLGWKLGTVADSQLMVWHDGGSSEGIGSLIAMLPERKMAVVLLGNAIPFEGSLSLPIAIEILEVMLETRDGIVTVEKQPAARVPVDGSVLKTYAGSYPAFGDILEVAVAGEQLKGSIQGFSFDLVPIAANRFRLSHWLFKLGLADVLQLPMDLGELEITFPTGDGPASDHLIIDFGGINYEIYPRYAALPEGGYWEALAGKYELYARLPSGLPGSDRLGGREITFENGRLFLSGAIGPILPIDDTTLIILGGPFHGETITLDPDTGELVHQGLVYKPVAGASK